MSPRERRNLGLVALLGLVVVVLLAWREDRAATDRRDRELGRRSHERLEGVRSGIARWTDSLRRTYDSVLDHAGDSTLAARLRVDPLVAMAFRVARGEILLPADGPPASEDDRAFRERTRRLFNGRAVVPGEARPEGEVGTMEGAQWIPWHWEDGLHILVQRRVDPDTSIGFELDRIALLSRLMSGFEPSDLGGGSMVLREASGRVLHQWGGYPGDSLGDPSLGSVPLAAPLGTWVVELHGPQQAWAADVRSDLRRSLVLRWGLVAGAYLLVVFLAGREWTRALREARQKTGFVQQVSHELRTPLTNIRLHAELAREGTLEEDTFRHLAVVGQETERLSRLVANILTFARSERGPLELRPAVGDLREILEQSAAPFTPFLERAGIRVEWSLPASGATARFEPDAASQILHNLLGNAIKYAAPGGWIGISIETSPRAWKIRVADRGPGIPERERENVFKPFHRLSDRITDGVAGTGIGLGIARDLARAMGGDLVLEAVSPGCIFLWTVPRSP